ncbi:hypothetical protein AAG906_004626 [Vitis piasezkii]
MGYKYIVPDIVPDMNSTNGLASPIVVSFGSPFDTLEADHQPLVMSYQETKDLVRGKHASDLEGEEEGIIGAAGTACLGDNSVECCQWRSTLRSVAAATAARSTLRPQSSSSVGDSKGKSKPADRSLRSRKLKHDVIEAVNEFIQDIATCHDQIFEQAVEYIHQNERALQMVPQKSLCNTKATGKLALLQHATEGEPSIRAASESKNNEKIEAEEAKISEGSQAEFDEAIDITKRKFQRPRSPRPEILVPHLVWQDDTLLVIGWGTSVKIASIRANQSNGTSGTHRNVSKSSMNQVDIVASLQTSYFTSEVAPFGDSLVVLAYILGEEDGEKEFSSTIPSRQGNAQRPEVHIVIWNNDELATDALPVHGFEHYKAKDYSLAHALFSGSNYAGGQWKSWGVERILSGKAGELKEYSVELLHAEGVKFEGHGQIQEALAAYINALLLDPDGLEGISCCEKPTFRCIEDGAYQPNGLVLPGNGSQRRWTNS